MTKRSEKVCFICGQRGADSREHVISRCFLPKGTPGLTQRFTLPAHRGCNGDFSSDEEYVRDLIGPSAAAYPDGQKVFESTRRSWAMPQGKRKLGRILSRAWLEDLRTPSGVVIGTGVVIRFEKERLQNIGRKIAQGIIFHDTGNFVRPESLVVAPMPSDEVPAERDRELKESNLFWQLLASEHCFHTNYSDSVAVRRAYTPVQANPVPVCEVAMLVMIYSQSLVVIGDVELASEPPERFILLAPRPILRVPPALPGRQ